ncbi:hypothetical protein JW824_07300 [bacterium]|nr:hypothetical protein [bacterium]RQV95302.1 MAG: hypothetical protein EH221_06590 [bacterium]
MKYGIMFVFCIWVSPYVKAETGAVHGYPYHDTQVGSDSTFHRYHVLDSMPEIRGDIKVVIPYDRTQSIEYKIKVIKPNPAIDYKILIKKPDPNIDYKILIKKIKNPFEINPAEYK